MITIDGWSHAVKPWRERVDAGKDGRIVVEGSAEGRDRVWRGVYATGGRDRDAPARNAYLHARQVERWCKWVTVVFEIEGKAVSLIGYGGEGHGS